MTSPLTKLKENIERVDYVLNCAERITKLPKPILAILLLAILVNHYDKSS